MPQVLDAVGPWLVGAVMFGFPVLLAWWLSDGFKLPRTVAVAAQSIPSAVSYRPVYNPFTSATCVAPVDDQTGVPVAYPD